MYVFCCDFDESDVTKVLVYISLTAQVRQNYLLYPILWVPFQIIVIILVLVWYSPTRYCVESIGYFKGNLSLAKKSLLRSSLRLLIEILVRGTIV